MLPNRSQVLWIKPIVFIFNRLIKGMQGRILHQMVLNKVLDTRDALAQAQRSAESMRMDAADKDEQNKAALTQLKTEHLSQLRHIKTANTSQMRQSEDGKAKLALSKQET